MNENLNSKVISQIMSRLKNFTNSGAELSASQEADYKRLRDKALGRISKDQEDSQTTSNLNDEDKLKRKKIEQLFLALSISSGVAGPQKHLSNMIEKEVKNMFNKSAKPLAKQADTRKLYDDIEDAIIQKLQLAVQQSFKPESYSSLKEECNDFSEPVLNKPVVHIRIIK